MGIGCCKERPVEVSFKKDNRMKNIGSMVIAEPLKLSLADIQIKKELKRGTLGRSYKVHRKETGEVFAMKVINKQTIENTGLTLNEKLTLTVFSPFVVHLQSAFEEGDYFYTIVEFIEGSEIFEEIKKHGKFDEDAVRFYLSEIILGLEELHNQNIVYRNLNPERVLLDKEGHVKLCDFGVYSVFEWPDDKKMGTMSEAIDYKSPEQVRGDEFDFRTDFWQLGILMYEMLSGKSPFMNHSRQEMEENIQHADLSFDSAIKADARDLITKLLKKDPAERLGSGSSGFHEIKTHPFFIPGKWNWNDVEQKILTPPIVPDVSQHEA